MGIVRPTSASARALLTCALAVAGACLFTVLRLPIPWLLGPMAAVLLGSRWGKLPLSWPGQARDAGILLVGYSIGLSLTKDALLEIARQLPSMLVMTVALIGLCAISAFFISRLSGIDFPTTMTASIPGGLTQIITLAEEFKQIDLTVVTFFQVTRLMMIVFVVPLLLFSPLFGGTHAGHNAALIESPGAEWGSLFPNIGLYLPVCLLSAWLGKKIKLPTAYMLGPMIATAALQLSGFYGPALPSPVLDMSQLLIGCYVGLLLQPGQLNRKLQTISFAFLGGAVLIAGALGLSTMLSRIYAMSMATGFLSSAPGGMDQMGIMAHEVGADLSIVSGYQTFRLLFIYFVVSYALKMMLKYVSRRTADAHNAPSKDAVL